MVRVPDDDDEIALLHQIRMELARDRTDIQRLWSKLKHAQIMASPVIESLEEESSSSESSSEESSSSSSSQVSSSEDLVACSDIPSTIYLTLSRISGSYDSGNATSETMNRLLGSHTMTKPSTLWVSTCASTSPDISGGWNRLRNSLSCSGSGAELVYNARAYDTPSCTGSGGPGLQFADSDFIAKYKNPFYAIAEMTYGVTGETFRAEFTE